MTKATTPARREAIVVALSLLGVALLFVFGTIRLSGEARVVPTSVIVPLLPILGFVFWQTLRTRSSGESAPPVDVREYSVLAWILLLPVLVTALGLIVGSALFVALWLRRRSGERWVIAILAGVATAAMLWLLGTTVLEGVPGGGLLQSMLLN